MVGEGCLSIIGLKVDTIRYREIKIINNGKEENYTGLLAVCVLHELQHFTGQLITDKGIIWRNQR
jgi:peptide deformylase